MVFLGGGTPAAASATTSRRRPVLVVLGLTTSFAAFTLFGTLLLSALHLPADLIRWVGLAALVILGIALIVPPVERLLERPFALIPQREVSPDRGGFALGIALGAVFVPCAGPVLAAITVAGATGDIGLDTIALTLSFAVGCAVPLLVFALAGRQVVNRVRAFRRHLRVIRIVSGAVMIALAGALAFNVTDAIQRYIPNYTEAVGNSLESGVQKAEGHSAPVSLAACQTAASYGGMDLQDCGPAPAFTGISDWLDTPDGTPISIAAEKGKVVLVDFWAYSCINCQRELPHVEAWYRAYADAGLEVVGVHTPEYAFEHDPANVAAGAQRLGLTFPIAIDDEDATWNAYGNQSWPAAYLIDAQGRIQHVSVGEGDYAHEEQLIRQLLTKADPGVALPAATDVPDTTPDDAQQTPETYLGSARAQYIAGGQSTSAGTRSYHAPASIPADQYALDGTWTVGDEAITAGAGARIELHYHASKVYLDVGGTGTLTVTDSAGTRTIEVSGAPDIYTVASTAPARDGTVSIALSSGLAAYSFTFG